MGAYGGGDSTFVGIEDIPEPIPNNFILLQNYPNPFNASTTIQYSLSEPSNIIITIYDIAGRKVETIIDGFITAGEHSVIWDADNYSSGIYFAHLKTERETSTRKIVLLK